MEDKLHMEITSYYTEAENRYPDYMSKLTYKERNNAKANFRRMAKPYHCIEGVLIHKNKEVLTRSRVPVILQIYHDNPNSGGHFGRDKTYAKISDRYYWYGMKKEVEDYIKKCRKCFAINPKIKKKPHPLSLYPFPLMHGDWLELTLLDPVKRLLVVRNILLRPQITLLNGRRLLEYQTRVQYL